MTLFVATHPQGLLIARGTPPDDAIAIFPGLGKDLPTVLRHLPPPVSEGIYDVSPCVALTAIGQCVKPAEPSDYITAFRECLTPVDKINTTPPGRVDEWARDIFGDEYRSAIRRVGLVWLKKDKCDWAYKMIHGGRSYWVRIDTYKAQLVERLARHRSRSPRQLEATPSAGSRDTPPDTSGNGDAP